MSTEIIELDATANSPAIGAATALVATKRSRNLAALARLSANEAQNIARNDYLSAQSQGVIKFLRLFILSLVPSGRWSSEMDGVTAEVGADGTLFIKVNGTIVCDDRLPGQERFIAGRWLEAVCEKYKQSELELARQERLAEQRKDEAVVSDLLADV